MIIEYKFNRITWEKNKTVVFVTFYAGQFTEVQEKNFITGKVETKSLFVRTIKLDKQEFILSSELQKERIITFFNARLVKITNYSKLPAQISTKIELDSVSEIQLIAEKTL